MGSGSSGSAYMDPEGAPEGGSEASATTSGPAVTYQ
jgi:hypothetical protein